MILDAELECSLGPRARERGWPGIIISSRELTRYNYRVRVDTNDDSNLGTRRLTHGHRGKRRISCILTEISLSHCYG